MDNEVLAMSPGEVKGILSEPGFQDVTIGSKTGVKKLSEAIMSVKAQKKGYFQPKSRR